jgi:hypothetical protein
VGAPYQPRAHWHRTRNWQCRVAAMMGAGPPSPSFTPSSVSSRCQWRLGRARGPGPGEIPDRVAFVVDGLGEQPRRARGQQANWQGMRLPSYLTRTEGAGSTARGPAGLPKLRIPQPVAVSDHWQLEALRKQQGALAA